MSKFKEILTKIDPEKKILTEDVQNELVSMMEAKEKTIKEEAMKDALTLAEKKYENIGEQTRQQIKEALEKQDADYAAKFAEAIEKKDADDVKMLDTIVEAMDKDHSVKFKKALKKQDKDHSGKLKNIVTKYGKKMKEVKESVASHRIVSAVDSFVDEYIKEISPVATVVNEAKLGRLEKMYGQLREMVMVNDETFQTEIKEAVLDAKKIIDEKDAEIDKLMFEKIEMKKMVEKTEAAKLLENKIKDTPPKMKAYLEVCFKDASRSEIEERFDEAVKAFKTEESKRRQTAVNEATSKKKIEHPVTSKEDEIRPIIESQKPASIMDSYAGIVTKMTKSSYLN
jgi:hypothetical protein